MTKDDFVLLAKAFDLSYAMCDEIEEVRQFLQSFPDQNEPIVIYFHQLLKDVGSHVHLPFEIRSLQARLLRELFANFWNYHGRSTFNYE